MIILDTNFLVYVAKYRIAHILENSKKELAVPAVVIEELENLSEKAESITDRGAARLALAIISKWDVKVLESEGDADSAIILLAEKHSAKVATMDKELSEKLRKKGVQVIKLRQKKKLSF